MEILRAIKNNQPFSANLAGALFNCLELQLLAMFFVNQSIPIYANVLRFITENSPLEEMVITNLSLNIIQLLYLGIMLAQLSPKKDLKLENRKYNFLKFLEIKPYLLFPQIINLNTLTLKNPSYFIVGVSIFNIVFALIEVVALKTVSISLRFIEKNHIRKKDNSILHWILIVAAMVSGRFFPPIYPTCFNLTRTILLMYGNFYSSQSQQVRKSTWFNTLVSTQVIILSLIKLYLDISIFNNLTSVVFVVGLTFYCANNLASTLSLVVLRYHLKKSTHIVSGSSKGQILANDESAEVTQKQIDQIILELRIMVNIYLSKLEYNHVRSKVNIDHQTFDFWWSFWDRFLLEHKVNCNNVNCECRKFSNRSPKNDLIEKRVYLDKIYSLIKMLSSKFSGFSNKLKIIQNHFLIQIERKPLKTYYQLIKLLQNPLSKQETLQVENLIIETRDIFKQLFLKQKVQNSELEVEPLFQFQSRMKIMRVELSDMANQYKNFYQIFASNFVPMQILKKNTKKLTEFKNKFNLQIQDCTKKYAKSIEIMVFSLIYYTYFDEYTVKLDKIILKAQCLMDYFKNSRCTMKRQIVEIFHPGFGAIKVDLVGQIGKILQISKNICHALGYSHRQVQGQKINNLMPYMFARIHDKILRNFIEKGTMKSLKYKQRVYYSRGANKFIIPMTIRLKVDYVSYQSLCAVAFLRPTPTKSQYILMNNYGKIEEMTSGLYKKCFQKAFKDQIIRVKKLCIPKMLLSVNLYLKSAVENDDRIREGILLTSDDQQTLMDYYKFPELGITKRHDNSISSNKNIGSKSLSQTLSGFTSSFNDLDFSQDINSFNVSLKESLKDYFRKLDTDKVVGWRVSYKLQDYITNEFKCKVLEITHINDPMTGKELLNIMRHEIINISKHFRIDETQYSRFKNIPDIEATASEQSIFAKVKNNKLSTLSANSYKSVSSKNYAIQGSQNEAQQVTHKKIRGDSEASSVVSRNEVIKKKESVIAAFEKKTSVNSFLEYGLTSLIFFMALMLIVICVFSMQLQGHYKKLQNDNLTIMNFRIDFLLRLGINELQDLYKSYDLEPPSFLQDKKDIVETRMKSYLEKSVTWIDKDISWKDYENEMTLKQNDANYTEQRSIYFFMRQFYANFAGDQTLTRYFTDNYITLSNYLVRLGNRQQALIMNESISFKQRISILIILYAFILLLVFVVSGLLLRISFKMEERIADFLPFFKASYASSKVKFYEKFIEYNKESENITVEQIESITEESHLKTFSQLKTQNFNSSVNQTQTKFIRVVNDQKKKISPKVLLAGIIIVVLCFFVIFFSEYFFSQAHDKFDIYLRLKNSAMLVQLVPSRIIMLYFININKLLRNQTMITFPDSYSGLAHDRLFELQSNTASTAYYGSQMQQLITQNFKKNICELIPCPERDDKSTNLVRDQQIFYMSYRYINSFNYVRRIIESLPKQNDPKTIVKKWMEENNVWKILQATEYMLELIKKDQHEISRLFSDQISNIGFILFSLSLTQIPILIIVMLYAKRKYEEYVSDKIESTENVYKHFSWDLLSENTYAINYFEEKLKKDQKV